MDASETSRGHSRWEWARIVGLMVAILGASGWIYTLRRSEVVFTSILASSRLNHELSYQLLTLGLFVVFVLLSIMLGGKDVLRYLRPNRFSGPITPVPWFGIRPKEGENWLHLGFNFLGIITVVTSVAVYFQVLHRETFSFKLWCVLLPALVFAATNALVEEGIYRFAITGVFLRNGFSAHTAAITSGVVFGGVHYFGTPGGVPGMFLAGFLGWFLSKSVAENQGFGWAWVIHFVQDVVIFTAAFGKAFGA